MYVLVGSNNPFKAIDIHVNRYTDIIDLNLCDNPDALLILYRVSNLMDAWDTLKPHNILIIVERKSKPLEVYIKKKCIIEKYQIVSEDYFEIYNKTGHDEFMKYGSSLLGLVLKGSMSLEWLLSHKRNMETTKLTALYLSRTHTRHDINRFTKSP